MEPVGEIISCSFESVLDANTVFLLVWATRNEKKKALLFEMLSTGQQTSLASTDST